MRDTSLDEFIGGDDAGDERDEPAVDAGGTAGDPAASEGGGADDGAAGESGGPTPGGEAAGEADDGDAPEPAVSTFEWTPAGAACAACGSDVERRWREDGELVCADCKAW